MRLSDLLARIDRNITVHIYDVESGKVILYGNVIVKDLSVYFYLNVIKIDILSTNTLDIAVYREK